MEGTFWQWWRPGTWSDKGIWSRAQECVRFSLRCSRPSWLSSSSSRSTAMRRVEINSLKDALNLVSFVRRATRGACFHVSTRGDESLSGTSYWSERDSVQLSSLPSLRGLLRHELSLLSGFQVRFHRLITSDIKLSANSQKPKMFHGNFVCVDSNNIAKHHHQSTFHQWSDSHTVVWSFVKTTFTLEQIPKPEPRNQCRHPVGPFSWYFTLSVIK